MGVLFVDNEVIVFCFRWSCDRACKECCFIADVVVGGVLDGVYFPIVMLGFDTVGRSANS